MRSDDAGWPAATDLDLRGVTEMLDHDTGVVIATSGSSGVPKRVAVSATALRASAAATAARIGQGRWILALPTHYVAGLQVLVRSVLAGTAPIPLERFTPEAFAAATRAPGAGPLYTSLVPAQFAELVAAAASDSRIRDAARAYEAFLIGGQATPVAVRDQAAELGIRLVRTYGSSETAGGCVYDGVPLDGVDVRTFEGELRIAGPTLADGYVGDPALTARTFVSDAGTRWYRTGDLGTVEDGVVAVTGRADNVIISGGVNVSLDRVERAVREIPGLSDAVIVPVDDERWGQASVIVAAVPDADAAALLTAARAAVASDIGEPARPRALHAVAAIPRLESGKPDRRALAAQIGR